MSRYYCFLLLVLNPALASTLDIKQKTNETDPDIVIINIAEGQKKDITQINKDLGDDIIVPEGKGRSVVNNPVQLWSIPVPYVLHESLLLNAKGVIMRAFDQFRLKSCIDFKVKENEEYFISVEKESGCHSYIGRSRSGGQKVSIGQNCDFIGVVEHEFLHALGFYHEQSRYDRDEHVTIDFNNIIPARAGNFIKVRKEVSTTSGVPYDYMSVMHYGSTDFSIGDGATIVTKDPAFQDIIGQRQEMSPSDAKELSLLYKCNSSVSFLMHCSSFSNMSMCGMSSCSQGGRGWESVTEAPGGPSTDHTTLPSSSPMSGQAPSSFMHASTAFGPQGASAWLETKRVAPSRPCPVQCLQFYYFHSGNESDQLNIWIREFQDENDSFGINRLAGQITGKRTTHWRYHHVSLSATKAFQVEFEARNGAGSSSGGFSIDDINLFELECPHLALQIDDFENFLRDQIAVVYSPIQYTSDGYAFRVANVPGGLSYGLGIQLMKGKNDDNLQWPLINRQITLQAVDQNPNIQLQMSKQESWMNDVFTDWNKPQSSLGRVVALNPFGTMKEMRRRDFIKGGSALFFFTFQDINPLINGSALPCPLPSKVSPPSNLGCRIRPTNPPPETTPPAMTTDDSIVGLAPALVSSALLTIFSTLMLLLH